MAVRTITTRLALDGEAQFKQAMTSINGALRNLKSELALSEAQFKGQANSVEALTAKNNILRQSVDQQKEKVRALAQAVVDATTVYGENSAVTDRYRQQLNRAQVELINMNRELDANSEHLREAEESADRTTHSLDEFGNETQDTGDAVNTLAAALQAAGVAAAFHQITQAIRACVDSSMEFETAMANLNKVAKLSDGELAALGEDIKRLSTEIPATTSEIAQVAEASRRLGIAQEALLSFTEVMVNLGGVSDLSADQAATALARFANIVGTSSADYERLGSTIVALGNNFATSESEITNMASRLAAAGKLAHLSESQIMGLAAAMSSVGIEAEAGGTAMTQTLTAMEKAVTSGGKKLDEFARIAGMSSSQFAEAWQKEPIEAIHAFIAGLGNLDSQGESATQVLEELGLSGIRQSNMLKSLALASETLAGTLATADQAWRENTELAETAAAKYDTTEAKMQMAANAANNLKIAVGDQLTPALGVLATAGTGAFSWAADFVAENPMLVSAITGLVTAAGVLTTGLTVYAAKAALATLATTSFGAALLATPIGPIAAGIGVLAAAFTAVAREAGNAGGEVSETIQAVESSRAAIEAQKQAAEEQRKTVESLAAQLDKLAGTENRTAGQKEQLLAVTEALNQAIPGLGLEYDKLSDQLNMTTEQVVALAEAQARADQLREAAANKVAAEQNQMDVLRELEQAQKDLAAAIEMKNKAEAEGWGSDLGMIEALAGLEENVRAAEARVAELEQALEESKGQADEAAAELEELAQAAQETGDGMESAAEQVEQAGQTAQEAAATMEELEEATLYAAGAADTLADALKEQEKEGSLSLKTANELIEAGYGAALAIDEETGAVTLNRDEYVRLASAKIQAQLATLETAKAEAEAARQHAITEAAATDEANAYHKLAQEKLAAEYADNIQALDLQIAALNRATASLNSYGGAVATAARRSSSASKKIKTQAEKDLEEYKALKAQLDHEKSVELVSEEEYYRKLDGYRDQYLTDDANVSEYRKVTEQIYKYDKSLADQEIELWAEQTDELIDELEKRVKSVASQQDKMEDRLSGYGDLFEVKDNDMTLNSIQEQIDAIDQYEQALNSLKERNISGGLMDEVLAMDVDSATQYANQLLDMSEEQWEQYNSLWDEKQKRAAQVAEQFFKDQLDMLEGEYSDKLGAALDSLTDTSFSSGENTAQGLIDGLASKENALYEQARRMAEQVSGIFSNAGHIPSSYELAAAMSTERFAERYSGVTPQDLQNVGAGVVNGISAMGVGESRTVVKAVLTMNDRVLAEEMIDPLQQVARERPQVKDD